MQDCSIHTLKINFIILFYFLKCLLLFNYSCMPFLPIPPPQTLFFRLKHCEDSTESYHKPYVQFPLLVRSYITSVAHL